MKIQYTTIFYKSLFHIIDKYTSEDVKEAEKILKK